MLNQKTALLCLATCIALSSITINCDSCESKKKTEETLEFSITKGNDFKSNEYGEFVVQKTKGQGKYANVKVRFANYASFVGKDGNALPETVELYELLGKKAEDEIDAAAMTIKVKAITPAPSADVTLKMSLGNDKNGTAYMGQTEAVTWKMPVISFTVDKQVINNLDQTAIITITKTGTQDIKYGDVYLLFSLVGTTGDLQHFCVGGYYSLDGNSYSLDEWPSLGCYAEDNIPNGDKMDLTVNNSIPTANMTPGEQIQLSIGTKTDAGFYVTNQAVVMWQ